MSTTSTLWQRFQQWPRALRWAVYAAVGATAFLVVNDHIWQTAKEWNETADAIETKLAAVRDGQAIAAEFQILEETLVAHGAVSMPHDENEGKNALNAAVNEVLNRYSVRNVSFELRAPANLKGSLDRISRGRKQAQFISGDLRFDATPEDAAAVLAELETSPDIEAVSFVRITRISRARRVKVHLTLEAWVLTSKTSRRRRGGA